MNERRNLLQESFTAIERLQARLEASERAVRQPIAIIGAGCRYPGGIETPEELWRVLYDGVDVVSDVPPDRWDVEAFYDPDPKVPGKMITRKGGFLSQVDRFDPQFFGISPREATTMDPQQRLLLETAYEAIESAGLPVDRLAGSATGVFVGITTSDYGHFVRSGATEQSDLYSVTGNALNVAAGRLSFTFGFQGPCVAVDTACSSSLVAVHLACQSLRARESDLALAGGVNVILSPDATVLFSKWGMMAPDGACKTFDAAANGFVRSEGCAVVALKRLSDAVAAGDPILAVIRGSAVNSDGRSSGLTVPNGPAQQALLAKALASAGLSAVDVDYVEAHGTGTSLGDPIEVEALGAVMCEGRSADRPLLIGSVKTNLGHTEAASGLAGLLKVVMALRHEAIPPHLHFSTPNPGIPWKQFPITVPKAVSSWSRGRRPRRAGVSSFGFSGTNAHVIVEEAPLEPHAMPTQPAGPFLVPLSARDDAALREIARRDADFLVAADKDVSLADVATTAASGRSHMTRRLALLTDSKADLERELRTFALGQTPAVAMEGTLRLGQQPKIAFLFTGQGSQYPGMGRGLYEDEPVFRAALDRMAAIVQPQLDHPLLEVMFADAIGSPLTKTAYTQPALFALEYALAELWRSWGITPSIVLGHSVGEYAAACVAGVFSPEDGLSLIAERGRLMQQLPAGGAMAAVFAKEAQVTARLASYGDRVVVAAVNGVEEVVISGDAAAVSEVVASLLAEGITTRMLDVSHAFHSRHLDPMLGALERRAASMAHSVPQIPLLSNLTGATFPADISPDAAYWRRHAREPVRFAACTDALRTLGVTALVEVGPHRTLLALAQRAAPGAPWASIPSLRKGRDDRREMLLGLATLYAGGAAVQWDAVNAHRGGHRVSMPTYPFQRERYWVSTNPARAVTQTGHPLLGERRELASAPGTFLWERAINLDTHPWLRDHQVQGVAILPGSAYVEMALAAAGGVLGGASLSLQQLEYLRPIFLRDRTECLFLATLILRADGVARFEIHSRVLERQKTGAPKQPWTAHFTARITAIESPKLDGQGLALVRTVRERCNTELNVGSFYAALARSGNQWGPAFRGLDRVWIGRREALGCVRVHSSLVDEMAQYRFHPAVADACGHALVATMSLEPTNGALVGYGISEVRFHRSPVGNTLWTHAKLRPQMDRDGGLGVGDMQMYDETGVLVSEALGARVQYLEKSADNNPPSITDNWYYETIWKPQQLTGSRMRSTETGPWLVFADRSGLAELIAARRKAAGLQTILVARGDKWLFSGDLAIVRPEVPADYQRLLESIGKATAIVHLWSLDAAETSATTDPMREALAVGAESLLHLLHSLEAMTTRWRPRIWLVTSGAQAVVSDDRCDAPWNAALWGLGKALSAEHSELWGGLVDLTPGLPAEIGADNLIREIEESTVEDKLAFRECQRYVARLVRRPPRRQNHEFVVRPDGTYLITGGLSGIGLSIARWLVDRGARQLLLLGRTPSPARETPIDLDPDSGAGRRVAAVAALESLGVKVETAAIDVAVEGEVERCLEARRALGAAKVCGVIHAAGVVQFQALATQDVASLHRVLAGKMLGAWRLHQVFLNEPLDCFVLCSSSAALFRSPLQGGYAAGNAFLDALAHHRRARGFSALSINWGVWGEVGMAVEADVREGSGMPKGIVTISTAKGIAALRELLEGGDTQVAVIPIDWTEFAHAYPAFMADPFLEAMIEDAGQVDQHPSASGLLSRVAESADAQQPLVRAYLRSEAARVLGMAPERIDTTLPLSSYGFDSLMAVQLKSRIEADLATVMPMIQYLQGPSIEQLLLSVLKAVQTRTLVAVSGETADLGRWEAGTL
jgi:acyl transferase domain-containing protein